MSQVKTVTNKNNSVHKFMSFVQNYYIFSKLLYFYTLNMLKSFIYCFFSLSQSNPTLNTFATTPNFTTFVSTMETGIYTTIIILNAITFVVYGIDKWKAMKNRWRIPESTLLLLAVVGGSIGALLGMKVWHHKTKHKKFKYGIPLIIVLQICVLLNLY